MTASITEDLPTLKQSAWMDPTLRRWLVALRPWSFPIGLVPIAVTGAVLHKTEGTALLSLDYVLCFVLVLSLHAAANLTNTYYDFRKKVRPCPLLLPRPSLPVPSFPLPSLATAWRDRHIRRAQDKREQARRERSKTDRQRARQREREREREVTDDVAEKNMGGAYAYCLASPRGLPLRVAPHPSLSSRSETFTMTTRSQFPIHNHSTRDPQTYTQPPPPPPPLSPRWT